MPDGTSYQLRLHARCPGQTRRANGRHRPARLCTRASVTVQRRALPSLTDKQAVGTPQEALTTYNDARPHVSNLPRLTVTDPLGRTTSWVYDAVQATLTSVTRLAGTANSVTSSATYQVPFNGVLTATDPLGHVTTIARNALGQAVSVTDPLGHIPPASPTTPQRPGGDGHRRARDMSPRYTYDHGDLAAVTDALGRTGDVLHRRDRPPGARHRPARQRRPSARARPASMAYAKSVDPLGRHHHPRLRPGSATSPASPTPAAASPPTTYDTPGPAAPPAPTQLGAVRKASPSYDGNGNPLASRPTARARRRRGSTTRCDRISTASLRRRQHRWPTPWDLAGNRLTAVGRTAWAAPSPAAYDGLEPAGVRDDGAGHRHLQPTMRPGGARRLTVPGQAQITYAYDDGNRLTSNHARGRRSRASPTTTPIAAPAISAVREAWVVGSYAYDARQPVDRHHLHDDRAPPSGHRHADLRLRPGRAHQRTGAARCSSRCCPQPIASARCSTWPTGMHGAHRPPVRNGNGHVWDQNGNLIDDAGLRSYTLGCTQPAHRRSRASGELQPMTGSGGGQSEHGGRGGGKRSYLYDGFDVVQEQVAGAPGRQRAHRGRGGRAADAHAGHGDRPTQASPEHLSSPTRSAPPSPW